MHLTERQKKYLRGLAHQKKAVVMIGSSGVSDNVMNEIDNALDFHELIKIKVRVGARTDRAEALDYITGKLDCQLIQRVGNSAVLFRRNPDKPKLQLPHGGV
ncbi:MAG: ribosome assembly RNA-binding protein YhbY [Gammaproteobacteria bacterium]|nr:ribosome assembly RNA-binding protein YhbY [Gammaproteobacteria bacterium]